MNPEYKAKWVAALRSGKYEQGRAALHKEGGGMCCLGVLCDVVKDEVGGRWGEPSGRGGSAIGFLINDHTPPNYNYPPFAVYALIGLTVADARVGRDISVAAKLPRNQETRLYSLSVLNDSGDYTFAQIADIIEEQL